MNKIVCNIELFSLHQNLFVVNEDGATKINIGTLEDLKESIANACHNLNIYHVHLIGNNDYIDNLIEEIKVYNQITYNNTKEIEFEVN